MRIAALVSAILACASWSTNADAQACCSGGGAYAPARLKLYEDGLVGIQLKGVYGLGSFDGDGHYASMPSGDAEVDLEEDIVGAYRLTESAQIGATIPIIETSRVESGLNEFGGGIGDITVHGRYDFIFATNERHLPGVSMVAAITTPTGRSPDQATTPLAVDATGMGYWQGALGLTVEQLIGRFVLEAGASLWGVLPRTINGITEELGPQIGGRFAAGYGFTNGAALAATISYRGATEAYIDGKAEPGGQALATTGVALGWPINFQWRIQTAVSYDLPWLGINHVAGVGATATVLRTF